MGIIDLSLFEVNQKIIKREVSVSEVLEETIKQIHHVENKINGYICVNEDMARRRAKEIQRLVDQEKKHGCLVGVPIAIKDNLHVKGMKTTCASRIMKDYIADYTADVVKRLEDAGAIIIGKTNMDEFAMGGTTETSFFGVTRNPWNLNCVPGGSSGGSGAVVAAKECYGALGSDTGGSIRLPGSFCGTVGLKPTFGLVPVRGLISYAKELDTIGPIARTVKDCEEIFKVIAKVDSLPLRKEIRGLKVGVPANYFTKDVNKEVLNKVWEAIKLLEKNGAVIEEFELKYTDEAVEAYYCVATAGFAQSFSELIRENEKLNEQNRWGKHVTDRVITGQEILRNEDKKQTYRTMWKLKQKIEKEFETLFSVYDVIIGPTTPHTAYPVGETKSVAAMHLSDMYIVTTNLAGVPAITIPIGNDKENLPIGIQITGGKYREDKILSVAYVLEAFYRDI